MSELRQRLLRSGPWLLLPIVAVAAFVFGTCTMAQPSAPSAASLDAGAAASRYTCSMHPQVRADEPGACPICGMDLVPVSSVEGSDRVALSERARVLAGVRTAVVARAGAAGARRLLGEITPDESTRRDVTAWIGGRIERLHVDVTGARIRRGQVIATLYSPEVYAAHQDLLVGKSQVARLAAGTPSARRAAESTLEAARQRLRLLGVPDTDLARMERASAPERTVRIRSPFSGTVLERVATEGSYVQTGAVLYRLADLEQLWVQLDAYESDLPLLAEGQVVHFSVDGLPGEELEGHVVFVDPVVDPSRRTARVRVEVDSQEGRLRPGMFVEARVAVDREGAEAPLVIPASAPLFTGRRSIVYVAVEGMDDPTYAPRSVRLGPRAGDVYPVIAGLAEGERVVVEGAFAVDADLQIRGGHSMMARPDDRSSGDAVRDSLTDGFRAGLRAVVEPYLDLATALAADDLDEAKARGEALASAAAAFAPASPTDAAEAWTPIGVALREAATAIAGASNIDDARRAFERASMAAITLFETFGNPTAAAVHRVHCPMAFDFAGADWVQRSHEVDNAYFGEEMRSCGTVRHAYPGDGDGVEVEVGVEVGDGDGDGDADGDGDGVGSGGRRGGPASGPRMQRNGDRDEAGNGDGNGDRDGDGNGDGNGAGDGAGNSPQAAAVYTCPMHPQIREPAPGRCPICNMNLRLAGAGGGMR